MGTLAQAGIPLVAGTVEITLGDDRLPLISGETDEDGNFELDPTSPLLEAGEVTLWVRGVATNPETHGTLLGDWVSITFTYAPTPPSTTHITNLRLLHDTGTDGDLDTTDPRVTGTIDWPDNSVATLPIEIDLDSDGWVDEAIRANADGVFVVDPRDFDVEEGEVTVRVRSSVWDEDRMSMVSDGWQELTFTWTAAPALPAPTIEDLRLLNDTGEPADSITTDVRIVGTIVPSNGVLALVPVEFDADGDGEADGRVLTDEDGQFIVDLNRTLESGPAAVAVRAAIRDERTSDLTFGSWQTLEFTFDKPWVSTPVVDGLDLVNDTDAPDDSITTDLRIAGTVTQEHGSLNDVRVEIDVDGDGRADRQLSVDEVTGAFTLDVSQFQPAEGPLTIKTRAIAIDPVTDERLASDWFTLEFTYQLPALDAPALTDVTVAQTPLGYLVSGTAERPEGYTGDVIVEYDLDGDEMPDESVVLDRDVNTFEFHVATADVPQSGTIFLRTSVDDANRHVIRTGDWEDLDLTSSPSMPTPVLVTGLALVSRRRQRHPGPASLRDHPRHRLAGPPARPVRC